MLVIGSEALAMHGLYTDRKQFDIDLIGTFDEVQSHIRKYSKDHKLIEARPFANGNKYVAKFADGVIFEYEIAWQDSTAEWLHQIVEADGRSFRDDGFINIGIPLLVPSIDLLYMLKLSHRYLKDSPHFLKTMDDIHLLRKFGAKFNDGYKDWFKKREEETYWYKHPRLMEMKKDNFFKKDEGVTYVYDHDSIHVEMARNHAGVPAYELYKKDGEQVECSKKKFFEVDEKIRLWGVLEEAQVLALERSQIPFKGKVDSAWSFFKALEKVCTSITSGWFREFAWENYKTVVQMYESDYADRFWEGVAAGRVKAAT